MLLRALTAFEKIADALASLAETARTPLAGLTPAECAAKVTEYAAQVLPAGDAETTQDGAGEAPKRRRRTKAEIEADKAAETAGGPAPQSSEDVLPATHYDRDREALTAAIVRIKGVMTPEKADPIVAGLMAAVGGCARLLHMNPAKYAAVTAAILAAIPEPTAHFGDEKPVSKPDNKPVTLEAVRKLAQELTAKLGDKQPVRDIIQRVAGTPKLTDVPKEKFAELFQALEEAA